MGIAVDASFREALRTIFALVVMLVSSGAGAFELVSPGRVATVFVPEGEPECVSLAAEDLVGDVAKITGRSAAIVRRAGECGDAGVVLVSLDRPGSAALLEKLSPGFGEGLKGKWEAYRAEAVRTAAGERLIVAGSDERGTMFGLYAFLQEHLGVDPLYFWSGREPQRRQALRWESVSLRSDGPTFRFRGWFINDEDLMTEWRGGGGERNIDYPYYSQVVHPEVMRAVAEALVRGRFNLIIPASFIDILNPPEEALVKECARRGVFLSQHHVEPMGVSAFSYFNYWKSRGKDLKYSYFSHPAEVREVWRVYAGKWASFPNVIWQLGLRGIADRPMWQADPDTPQSGAERGRLISEAMAEQLGILRDVCPGGPKHFSTTLWAEGSALNQQGHLRIPEGAIVVFADNSPGWKWQEDFHSTPRDPKNRYGVYYHHGLIGSGPHLAQVVSPHKTYECLKAAVGHGAGEYAIFNVANLRELVLGIGASADMAWRMEGFDPDAWMESWVGERFSCRRAEIANAYHVYFSAWQIHDEQGVPFLMDGQMFGMGNRELGGMAKQIKSGKIGGGASLETSRQAGAGPAEARAEAGRDDAFWTGLADMHPRSLGRRETIKRLAAQRAGLELALLHARASAAVLPGDEASFLEDNLVYQASIMARTCEWLENVLVAHEALDLGDGGACVAALEAGAVAFSKIPELAKGYCRGKWEDWYRGCKKLNISATMDRTRAVLEQARGAAKEGDKP